MGRDAWIRERTDGGRGAGASARASAVGGPIDPIRPQGESRGGSIWLHMDHGSGKSGCVSQSEADMEYLLRTIDPAKHPVIVMGDRADLEA
jgi:hypothetical protein